MSAALLGLADAPAYSTYHYTYGNSAWGDRLKEYRNITITYDAIGNPISYHNGSDYSLTWQNGRQLKRAVKGSEIFLFTYDAEGRRTSKDSYGNKVIYYVWDGDLLVAEYVPYETIYTYFYDASGSPVGFTYTDETGYYEGGVTTTYFYEKNLQGDIVGILDYFGNRIVQYDYDAWGNLIRRTVQSGDSDSANYKIAEDNPFRYRGYYYDRETGFYYLKSRYYDPVTGRFINADSYVSTGSGLLGYNMYAYCNNNPVNMGDPSGNWPRWITKAVAAVGAVVTVVGAIVAAPVVTVTAAVATTGACITYVAQSHHYDKRKEKNQNVPQNYDEAMEKEGADNTISAKCHQFTADDKSNIKVCWPDGTEGIYDSSGNLVTDPRDVGTYNISVPNGGWSSVWHRVVDVLPWIIFGNDDNDTTWMHERIIAYFFN